MNYITYEQYEKICRLVDCAINAPNKKEAKRYVNQLDYVVTGLTGGVNVVFSQLKAETAAASGRIAEKERRIYYCHTELYKLKDFVIDAKEEL